MEFIIIFLAIVCLIEAWLLIEAGRELDRVKNEGSVDIESLVEATNERNTLKNENEELREEIRQLYERITEDMDCDPPICTCDYEETCAGFPEHNMTKEEMDQEMRNQYEQELKALEARRMTYVCQQCGKRGGCYCNGLTSDGEVIPF